MPEFKPRAPVGGKEWAASPALVSVSKILDGRAEALTETPGPCDTA